MKPQYILTLCLALAVWLGGCASPEARIKRSPDVFARLTPEQQSLVKEGKVGIGFDADAVRLAVGKPDRVWTRTDAKGTRDVWSYTTFQDDAGAPLYQGWYHTQMYPGLYPIYNPGYRGGREREYFRVVFGPDGKVTAVEQDTRS
jgi:hypothetical protein